MKPNLKNCLLKNVWSFIEYFINHNYQALFKIIDKTLLILGDEDLPSVSPNILTIFPQPPNRAETFWPTTLLIKSCILSFDPVLQVQRSE